MDQADRPAQRDRQPDGAGQAVEGGDPGRPHQPRPPRRVAVLPAEGDTAFRFAQFEFPWALGPDDGRYVMRDRDAVSHVVVLRTLGAPERRRQRARRPRAVEAQPAPEPVSTGSVTVIETPEVPRAEARDWLSQGGAEAVEASLAVVNRVLHAHRLAAADPTVREVSRERALVARLGYGNGDQVADGRWDEAVEVPPPREPRRARRTSALRPQERLAALLGGRDRSLACEDLVLRARADLDAGRDREAALQVRVALEAALAELSGPAARARDMPERLAELRERRGAIGDAANRALTGPLDAEAAAAVTETVERLEAALRARSAAGFDT